MALDRPEAPKDAILSRGLKPKKSFGQNFLVDQTHVQGIAGAIVAGLKAPLVIELGAGTGALTRALIDDDRVRKVHAVERDRDLAPVLRDQFAGSIETGRFTVHEADAATVDLHTMLDDEAAPRVLAGNLPYHLTSTLLFRAVEHAPVLERAVFLIQKEVADRVAAVPGEKDYSVLSVAVGARFTTELARIVPRGAFWPVPEVDGGVIVLERKETPPVDEALWPSFISVVKAAFSQRRKTLRNTLKSVDPDQAAMRACAIDPGARAETLTVDQFAQLAIELQRQNAHA